MSLWKRVVRHFIPLSVVVVAGFGFIYLIIQQNLRSGANDPQVQMSQDAAYALAYTSSVEEVIQVQQVDISRSMAPFLIVYDSEGNVLGSSASLNGSNPVLPNGVLAFSGTHGGNRVTWQPAPGVRIAAVIEPVETQAMGMPAYVLAGRSLREVESRADQFLHLTLAGMLVTLAAVLAAVFLVEWILRDRNE